MQTAGPIEGTEGFDRLVPKETKGNLNPAKRIPIQRFGTKDDIANATVYLCSPAASYVSNSLTWLRENAKEKQVVDRRCFLSNSESFNSYLGYWHSNSRRWRRGKHPISFKLV